MAEFCQQDEITVANIATAAASFEVTKCIEYKIKIGKRIVVRSRLAASSSTVKKRFLRRFQTETIDFIPPDHRPKRHASPAFRANVRSGKSWRADSLHPGALC